LRSASLDARHTSEFYYFPRLTFLTAAKRPNGKLGHRFGDHSANISIEETTSAVLRWSDQQGKELKGVPASVKQYHGGEWKDLQRTGRFLAPEGLREAGAFPLSIGSISGPD
jgi:hypothetical protein